MPLNDPVPSSALDVLKRNSEDFDKLINDDGESVTTRTGDNALTIAEFQRRFRESLENLGLEYPPIDYVSGIEVERNTQTFRYQDVIYVNTRSDLPFTTTGAFDEGGWQIVQQVNQSTVIFSADGIKGLDSVALIDRAAYSVSGFYAGTEVGGGQFIYDASRDKADHDGVKLIAPEAITAWDGTVADVTTFTDWADTGTGCFVRLDVDEMPNLMRYLPYVKSDGLWNDALNEALDAGGGACYAPGRDEAYRVENFTRRIGPANNNVAQESVRIVGDKTGYTVNHQYMIAKTVFEGDGDIFLDVVNYAFENVGIRNRSSSNLGALFTLYGNGAEAGSFIGCYFGLSNYHIYNPESDNGNPSGADYIIGAYLEFCAFFHAHIMSRYYGGQTASGYEKRCYTSHCQGGLYLRAPGPGYSFDDSVFEYINDYGVDIYAFGSVANYSLLTKGAFFETCGGGRANIPGKASNPKAQATPSIAIRSQTNPSGAKIKFDHTGLFFTYTDSASKPVAWVYIDSNTVEIEGNQSMLGVGSTQELYTADEFSLVDPFNGSGNTLRGDRNITGVVGNGALFERGEATVRAYDKYAGGQLHNFGDVTTDSNGDATFTPLKSFKPGTKIFVQTTVKNNQYGFSSALINNESNINITTKDTSGAAASRTVSVTAVGVWK